MQYAVFVHLYHKPCPKLCHLSIPVKVIRLSFDKLKALNHCKICPKIIPIIFIKIPVIPHRMAGTVEPEPLAFVLIPVIGHIPFRFQIKTDPSVFFDPSRGMD